MQKISKYLVVLIIYSTLYPETNKTMKIGNYQKMNSGGSREDARTIERYNEIINDKSRLDRAMKLQRRSGELD